MKYLIALLVTVTMLGVVSAHLGGPPPGHTGAPGEGTCADAGCHQSYPLDTVPFLSAGMSDYGSSVQPFRIYVDASGPDTGVYGFQLTVKDTLGQSCGTLVLLDSLRTQLVTDSLGTIYATHTAAGTPSASNYWRVGWFGEADTQHTIVVHAASVRADGDGSAAGDYVATDEWVQTLTPGFCPNICGDVNWSNTVTSADLVSFFKYVHYAILFSDYACSEMDGHQSLNLRDVLWLAHSVFDSGPAPICPAHLPLYVVQPSTDFRVRVPDILPAGASRLTIYPEFKGLVPFSSISADLKIDVEGVSPWIDSASHTEGMPGNEWASSHYLWDINQWIGSDSVGVVMITMEYYNFDTMMVPGTYPLGYFRINLPPAPYARRINYRLQGFPEGDNAPMMVDTGLVGWEIQLETYSVRKTGDANNDGVLTSSDIIGLVNYIFKAGPSPHPVPATGDCNCSGSVTSADIIVTVNHVFKGGPPVCDVESECTIDLEEWTCP